jgi:hypothetical protein
MPVETIIQLHLLYIFHQVYSLIDLIYEFDAIPHHTILVTVSAIAYNLPPYPDDKEIQINALFIISPFCSNMDDLQDT